METPGRSVQLAGTGLGQHGHACTFVDNLDERHGVLGSFIKDGLEVDKVPLGRAVPDCSEIDDTGGQQVVFEGRPVERALTRPGVQVGRGCI